MPTSTISTSSTARATADRTTSSRTSARSSGSRATPGTTASTGWSAAITRTRSCPSRQSRLRQRLRRFSNCLVAANFVAGGAPSSLLAPGHRRPASIRPSRAQRLLPRLVGGNMRRCSPRSRASGNTRLRRRLPSSTSRRSPTAALPTSQPRLALRACRLNGTGARRSLQPERATTGRSSRTTSFGHRPAEADGRRPLHAREEEPRTRRSPTTMSLCAVIRRFAVRGAAAASLRASRASGRSYGSSDTHSENKLSGTVVLSYKPTDRLLTYASYSHGYKAGGFNLDRSALFRASAPQGVPPMSGSGAICVISASRAAAACWLRAPTSSSSPRQRRVRTRRQIPWSLDRPQLRRVPRSVPRLPAEHFQRPQLRRREHQQLQRQPERRRHGQ